MNFNCLNHVIVVVRGQLEGIAYHYSSLPSTLLF
jgi:hypothetical protein